MRCGSGAAGASVDEAGEWATEWALPVEAYAVVPGTRFLVKLEDELNTETSRRNNRFKVRTLEPLEAGSGIYLPAGAEIIGHISRVESAGIAGRAKIWLTFDDIQDEFWAAADRGGSYCGAGRSQREKRWAAARRIDRGADEHAAIGWRKRRRLERRWAR